MAKKTDKTNTADLLASDFLGDVSKFVNTSTGSGIYEKQAALYRQEVMKPVVTSFSVQNVFTGIIEQQRGARKIRDKQLKDFLDNNPEIDESLLYGGIEDIAKDIMKSGNMTYREVVGKLAGMNVNHPEYDKLTKQLNEINNNTAQLKKDNEKLLLIKNEITASGFEKFTEGMSDEKSLMYEDIIKGNTENFKNINGRLVWQNPGTKETTGIDEVKSEEFDKLSLNDKITALNNSDITTLNKELGPDFDTTMSSEDYVKTIQTSLVNLGYKLPKKGIDGKMGDETRAAIEQYEKDLKEGTGNIGSLIDDYRKGQFSVTTTSEYTPVDISSISADVNSIMPDKFAENESFKLQTTARTLKDWDKSEMMYRIDIMFDEIGDNGVQSLIFDGIKETLPNGQTKLGTGLHGLPDTSGFFDEWYEANGITSEEGQEAEYNRLRNEGVGAIGANGISVKDAFSEWYHDNVLESQKNQGSMFEGKKDKKDEKSPPPPPPSENNYDGIDSVTDVNKFKTGGTYTYTYHKGKEVTKTIGKYGYFSAYNTTDGKKRTYIGEDGKPKNMTKRDFIWVPELNNGKGGFAFAGHLQNSLELSEKSNYYNLPHETSALSQEMMMDANAWGGPEAMNATFLSVYPVEEITGYTAYNNSRTDKDFSNIGMKIGDKKTIQIPWEDSPRTIMYKGKLGGKHMYELVGVTYKGQLTQITLEQLEGLMQIPHKFLRTIVHQKPDVLESTGLYASMTSPYTIDQQIRSEIANMGQAEIDKAVKESISKSRSSSKSIMGPQGPAL